MARLVIFDKDGVVLDLQATWLPVARAVAALGITVPVRAATRRGKQIVLQTRSGEYSWTPPSAKARK